MPRPDPSTFPRPVANLRSPCSTTNRSSTDNKDAHPRHSLSNRRLGGEALGVARGLSNGVTPLNTGSVASPGASSAFGLGSGAFASFGSANKTPKTPGTTFDYKSTTSGVSTPVEEKTSSKLTTSKPGSQLASSAPDLKSPWPLKYSWVLWYRPPTSKNSDYEKSIKPMYKMSTAQHFWKVYTHVKKPSALPTVSDYHFFKDGIRPVWEDEENKKGGKWIMRLKKGVMDRYWEDLLMATVGDQFAEAGEEVCGMVVSVRTGEDVLSIWTKNDGGRNIKIR